MVNHIVCVFTYFYHFLASKRTLALSYERAH